MLNWTELGCFGLFLRGGGDWVGLSSPRPVRGRAGEGERAPVRRETRPWGDALRDDLEGDSHHDTIVSQAQVGRQSDNQG